MNKSGPQRFILRAFSESCRYVSQKMEGERRPTTLEYINEIPRVFMNQVIKGKSISRHLSVLLYTAN